MSKNSLSTFLALGVKSGVKRTPSELANRLRFHFILGACSGAGIMASVTILAVRVNEGRLSVSDCLSPAIIAWFAWTTWQRCREDLRELTHFELVEKPEQAPDLTQVSAP